MQPFLSISDKLIPILDDLRYPSLGDCCKAIVIVWPNYVGGNPYQRLLYRQNRLGAQYFFGDIDSAIELLVNNVSSVPVVFHLHWLTDLVQKAKSANEAEQCATVFIAKLRHYKSLGGTIIWTIHNDLTHDANFLEAETFLSQAVGDLADKIHVHCSQSISEIQSFSVPQEKVIEVPHGHYVGAYSDYISKDEARAILGFKSDDDVCLFVGQIRPYKGVESLVAAYREVRKTRPKLKLLIVGSKRYDPFALLEEPLTSDELAGIIIYDTFVKEDALQLFFSAADFSVYPYFKVLTSGSVLLSLSFRVPFAAADRAMIRQIISNPRYGVSIGPSSDSTSVSQAIGILLERKDSGMLTLESDEIFEFQRNFEWRDFSTEVIKPAIDAAGEISKRERLRRTLLPNSLHASINIADYRLISNSQQFQRVRYSKFYPTLMNNHRDEISSYLQFAKSLYCSPREDFSVDFYMSTFSDCAVSGIDPFSHYLRFAGGRRPTNSASQHDIMQDWMRKNTSKLPKSINFAHFVIFWSDEACANFATIEAFLEKLPIDHQDEFTIVSTEFDETFTKIKNYLRRKNIEPKHIQRISAQSAYRTAINYCHRIDSGEQLFVFDLSKIAYAESINKYTNLVALRSSELFVLVDNDEIPELILGISLVLFKLYSPKHSLIDDANFVGITCARVRQAQPATQFVGSLTKDPTFGLSRIHAAYLAEAEIAFLSSDGQVMPPLAFSDAAQAIQMFDFFDNLGDQLGDAQKRETFRQLNRAAKAEIVRLSSGNPRLGGILDWVSGPMSSYAGPGDAVVVACVKNDEAFLPAFLEHYRALGAKHIIIIDDNSDKPLSDSFGADDLSIYRPIAGRFLTSKTLWMELLIKHFCPLGTWIVTVDADELLDLPSEAQTFDKLAAMLFERGQYFLPTLLVDMLPDIGGVSVDGDVGVDMVGSECDFISQLSHVFIEDGPAPSHYVRNNTVRWGFGDYAQLSWQIDARYHVFEVYECLRKISVFLHQPGIHLNQGFHSIVSPIGQNMTQSGIWKDHVIGFIRHYKFRKYLAESASSIQQVFDDVYFEETAKNLARSFGQNAATTLARMHEKKRVKYSVEAMEEMVDFVRSSAHRGC